MHERVVPECNLFTSKIIHNDGEPFQQLSLLQEWGSWRAFRTFFQYIKLFNLISREVVIQNEKARWRWQENWINFKITYHTVRFVGWILAMIRFVKYVTPKTKISVSGRFFLMDEKNLGGKFSITHPVSIERSHHTYFLWKW